MENELVKTETAEVVVFDEKQQKGIEAAFAPQIAETEALVETYGIIIAKEKTPELAKEARALRLTLKGIRGVISNTHKVEKAYSLAYGKFCDAKKIKYSSPCSNMEEKLMEIEKFVETQEKEALAKLETERIEVLKPYDVQGVELLNLGLMTEETFENYLCGVELSYNKKKEEAEKLIRDAEEKAQKEKEEKAAAKAKADAEAKAKREAEYLHQTRKDILLDYWDFVEDFKKEDSFSDLSDAEFTVLIEQAMAKKEAHDEEQAKVKEENDRLKAEAEAKAKQDAKEKAEREAAEKEAQAKLDEERKAQIAKQEAARKVHAENEAKIKREAEEKLAREQAATKLANDKLAAIEKEKADKIEADAKMGDAEKINQFATDLREFRHKYKFESDVNSRNHDFICGRLEKMADSLQVIKKEENN